MNLSGASRNVYPLSIELYQQKTCEYGSDSSHHARHHKGMVENIFSDMGGSGTVEVYRRYNSGIIGYKEITVDSGEQGNQHPRTYSESDSERHDSPYCSCLAIEKNRHYK